MDIWAQWGLVGAMIGAIFFGIAWAGKRLLGKDGILENHTDAMRVVSQVLDGVTTCVERHVRETGDHALFSESTGRRVTTLQRAALAALSEIEDECSSRGVDVSARVQRVRQVLVET